MTRVHTPEIRDFIACLRSGIWSADDFLAQTRPPAARQARTPGDP